MAPVARVDPAQAAARGRINPNELRIIGNSLGFSSNEKHRWPESATAGQFRIGAGIRWTSTEERMIESAARIVLSGILNLNKPSGMTSRDVVDHVGRQLRGVKVGHAGTLDPLASGVLVVCISSATRLIDFVQRMPKTYRTVVRLGARSDTLDAEGEVIETDDPHLPDEQDVRRVVAGMVGEISQLPPVYSAKKIKGRRSYDLARAGRPVQLAPRLVRIDRIDLLNYSWPRLELEIACGGGTYIRSIARDVGEALGCGGLVETLVRTLIGHFTLETAIDPAVLSSDSLEQHIRPSLEAVPDLPRVVLDQSQVAEVLHGRTIEVSSLPLLPNPETEIALLDSCCRLIAIGHVSLQANKIQPRKVFL
jgi:tRNA pseudouridine55 synthase